MRPPPFLAFLLLLPLGCQTAQGPAPSVTTTAKAEPTMLHLDANLRARQQELDRNALAGAVSDTPTGPGGPAIADPFRGLEADSPETQTWIAEQTAITKAALAPFRDPATEQRLSELLSIGAINELSQGGKRLFFTLREGDREQAALYMFDGALRSEPLVDPLRTGPRAALDYNFPSPAGRYVAYGLSDSGDERATLHILDVDADKTLPDTIARAKWSSVAWLRDESGFYYTRYPKPGEPGYDLEHEESYFPGVYFHRLGTDPDADPLLFRSETATDFPVPAVGDGDRYVLVMNYRGWTASDVFLLDRGEQPTGRIDVADPHHPLVGVTTGRDKLTSGVVHNGTIYLITNEDAPRNRIVAVDPKQAGERADWRTVVPESEATIQDWAILSGHLAVHHMRNVRSELSLFSLSGEPLGQVPMPTEGSIDTLVADPEGDSLSFLFSSFFFPPALFRFTPGQATPTQLYQVAHDLDTNALALSRAQATSHDGTPVNIFYIHRRDLARTGSAPVFLTGYGGFDVSLLPSFTRTALYWVEQGGVYAVANLRGGGEFGEAWHRAGMLMQKERVFEDFEAATDFFVSSGISRPERIAISGGSNGGLLMGAMITRSPDRFGAAIANVGLYDMLRYALFPPAELWVSEYGDPDEPEAARYLHGYSPYHNVKDGVAYPYVLIETADHDTRVHWAHSTKFAARLQLASSSDRPILFYMERSMGHGRGTRLSDLVEMYARRHAFLRGALGF